MCPVVLSQTKLVRIIAFISFRSVPVRTPPYHSRADYCTAARIHQTPPCGWRFRVGGWAILFPYKLTLLSRDWFRQLLCFIVLHPGPRRGNDQYLAARRGNDLMCPRDAFDFLSRLWFEDSACTYRVDPGKLSTLI